MRVTYDAEADAAYIYLTDGVSAGRVARTCPCDPQEVGGMVSLDFDSVGRLIGIEVMDAARLLPPEALQIAP